MGFRLAVERNDDIVRIGPENVDQNMIAMRVLILGHVQTRFRNCSL